MIKITPCLWFDNKAEEALDFYISIFKSARVTNISRYPETNAVLTAIIELEGQEFMLLNADSTFQFSHAISFFIDCKNQREVDFYWDHLLNGGEAEQCGWLRNRFGVSWQIVLSALEELMSDPDPKKSKAVLQAMLQIVKLDVPALQKAYNEA